VQLCPAALHRVAQHLAQEVDPQDVDELLAAVQQGHERVTPGGLHHPGEHPAVPDDHSHPEHNLPRGQEVLLERVFSAAVVCAGIGIRRQAAQQDLGRHARGLRLGQPAPGPLDVRLVCVAAAVQCGVDDRVDALPGEHLRQRVTEGRRVDDSAAGQRAGLPRDADHAQARRLQDRREMPRNEPARTRDEGRRHARPRSTAAAAATRIAFAIMPRPMFLADRSEKPAESAT